MQTVPDPSQELSVAASVDLLVVGGGMTGVTASIAAGRLGLKTLIVEQFNCLGGTATSGGHNHISQYHAWDSNTRVVGGITYEIADRIINGGYGTWDPVGCIDYHLEGMKLVLDQMVAEAGVEVLYYTFFCEALVDDNGHVTGVIVQNKSGRQAIMARRIIDCTGDGDVAASAGAPFQQGREPDGLSQPTTLMFTIGGVDWPVTDAWRTEYKMTEVWLKAQADGIMEPFQNVIMGWWHTDVLPDQVGVNMTHITHIDTTNVNDLTNATIEGRRQAHQLLDVFKQVVPGMESAYLISTAPALGLRESRRIVGPVVLHEDDILSEREWDDVVCYGSFYVDIHNLDGPGMSETTIYPPEGFCYQIPYRVMVPQNVESLLVAGRCISTTHVALGSTRVMVTCMALGEAAGAAAAISLREETAMIDVPMPELQAQLRQQNAILDRGAIDAAN